MTTNNDLIARLRADATIYDAGDDIDSSKPMRDAADAIEYLQRECAELTAKNERLEGQFEGLRALAERATTLAAEVDRLNSIVNMPATQTAAARDVLAERKRQVTKEGWTPEHDDAHDYGACALAAACYAINGAGVAFPDRYRFWPWDLSWFKPDGARRDFVKAGALILAEIERIDRSVQPQIIETGEQI